MFKINSQAEISSKTIEIKPINVWLNVKNVKHQTMFKMPLIISSAIVEFFKFSLLTQLQRTIANVK